MRNRQWSGATVYEDEMFRLGGRAPGWPIPGYVIVRVKGEATSVGASCTPETALAARRACSGAGGRCHRAGGPTRARLCPFLLRDRSPAAFPPVPAHRLAAAGILQGQRQRQRPGQRPHAVRMGPQCLRTGKPCAQGNARHGSRLRDHARDFEIKRDPGAGVGVTRRR